MTLKIGFYICHCGINIAHKVRVEEVADFARKLDSVVVARDYKFMCSDPGQEMIEKDIREYGLNRVVVASCSPRLHEKTFQGACKRAGLNPYMFQMASVREQVSWVTADEDIATRKAKTLAAGAISRVHFHQGLETREVDVHPDIMVVGGGIAGMQAALDIGNSGGKVYLVERSTTIGGHMLQFDKTFPTLDCAACIGTPKMVEVAQNENIELLSYSEVEDVSGYIGNYNIKVRRKPRYIKEGVCTGCGECEKVCPVALKSEWDEELGGRKAIYRAFPQAVPITYCIDKKDRAPCVATCPAHVNVQGYIALINQGKYREALELFKQDHPFPGVCGRVCNHPCEESCSRNEVDTTLSIMNLHRFIADKEVPDDRYVPEKKADRDEKVAIVGGGPAGLTCAYFLAIEGYQVTVFEKLPVLGGMLTVGIPSYRLPRDVIEAEIQVVKDLGVKFKTGVEIGKDITVGQLREQGYKAFFIGIGAHECKALGLDGEDLKGVFPGVEFLREVNLGKKINLGDSVAVIGGGNVAMDAVRTALRTGSKKPFVIYRRSYDEMPANIEEIEECAEEGIEIMTLTNPVRIIEKDGRVEAIECIKMELGEPDDSGRRRPQPLKGSEFIIEIDTLMPSIGQESDWACLTEECVCTLSDWGTMKVDEVTLQTGDPDIFAGGDAVSGPKTVVEAVAAGKTAAESIHRYINGLNMTEGRPKEWILKKPEDLYREPHKSRTPVRCLDPEARECNFLEVSLGYNEDEARKEADRCLNCGVCSECMECVKACEANAIDHTMKETVEEFKVGSIILATGYDVMDPTPMKNYGYGKYDNVFTSLEFERLSNATGPTGGKILIRDQNGDFTRKPESVALLHCIGSRDVNYHEYCSRVCCMYALKYSHLIKEKVGHDTKVYDFYIDQRCFGKGYEEFYKRCQQEGTVFVRGKVAEITDQIEAPGENGKLVAVAEDTLMGSRIRVPVDMVVLCVAMEARSDAPEVGRIFGTNVGADGFFLEEHPKLGPLNTATDGVFLAGACQGPKDIPDTVAQASGAAAKALSLAKRGKVQVPSAIAWIDPDICIGCQQCIGLCPYTAIEYNPRRGISVINEALCKGCGSCAGFCPSSAAQVRHFKEKQLFSEIDGIFDAIKMVGM